MKKKTANAIKNNKEQNKGKITFKQNPMVKKTQQRSLANKVRCLLYLYCASELSSNTEIFQQVPMAHEPEHK